MPKMPLIATVPLTALIVGARAGLLRNGQNIGPQLAQPIATFPTPTKGATKKPHSEGHRTIYGSYRTARHNGMSPYNEMPPA